MEYTQPILEAQSSSIIPSPFGQKMSAAEKRAKQQYIENWVMSTQKYMGVYSAGTSRSRRKTTVVPSEEPKPEKSSHDKSTSTTVRKSVSTPEGSKDHNSNEENSTTAAFSDSAVKSILKRLHGLKPS